MASSVAGVAESVEELGGKVVAKDVSAGPLESNTHLAVATNAVKDTTVLSNLAASVKAGGFVLSFEDTAPNNKVASSVGLQRILKLVIEGKVAVLYRKVSLCLIQG